jgi:hypothetical protein
MGFWSTVSGAVLVKFLFQNFLQEKTRNDHFDE